MPALRGKTNAVLRPAGELAKSQKFSSEGEMQRVQKTNTNFQVVYFLFFSSCSFSAFKMSSLLLTC